MRRGVHLRCRRPASRPTFQALHIPPGALRRMFPAPCDVLRTVCVAVWAACILLSMASASTGGTRDYAVEVSATVEESPPHIDFSWVADPTAVEYRILRKQVGDTAWTGPVAVLEGSATSWTDTDVSVGEAYEYAFRKSRGVITDSVAVASGTALTFTIHDSWGDGICCDMGLGSYEVSACGVICASGGSFGSYKSTSFTVGTPEDPCDEVVVLIVLDIFGEETTWELTEDATGDTLASGGPYSAPRFGHMLAGIRYLPPEDWGTVLLLVDGPVADSLSYELGRLEIDMIKDGYRVRRRVVPDGTPVPAVKDLIVAECQGDPSVTALLILGNIEVPYSGNVQGAHANHRGAWPADLYYGELNGAWTDSIVNNTTATRVENHNVPGDGKFDQTFLPSDVDLEVGRVDLSRLPAFAESEVGLLRRYLDKNHAFRSGEVAMPRRGIIRDAVGVGSGTAYACTGWRNFTAMFGSPGVHTDYWFPALEESSYLCAYGCGGGTYTSCSTVATTTDFATRNVNAVFTMLMGSYFGDWDNQNNLMRAAIAADGHTLSCCWAGKPAWHFHHMALGHNVGYSTRITQNNHLLYMIGYGGRQIHISLLGDPTLRLIPVKPPVDLVLEEVPPGEVRMAWTAPAEAVLGCHVYRARSASDAFTRISADIIEDTSYVDIEPLPGRNVYMVRAVKLETTASGTYLNLSPGALDSVDVRAGVDPSPAEALLGAFPNPFTAGARITCHIPRRTRVILHIHDVAGRLVREIDAGEHEAGRHRFEWDGRDDDGRRVASGVYFLCLKAGGRERSTKMVRVQ